MQPVVQIEEVDRVVAEVSHSRLSGAPVMKHGCGGVHRPRDHAATGSHAAKSHAAESHAAESQDPMPFPINIPTPCPAKRRSPPQAVAHELLMTEPEADAPLYGIAPGHQDEADHHANEQGNHPGRPVEHESPEWLERWPRRRRRLDAEALQRLPQRLA